MNLIDKAKIIHFYQKTVQKHGIGSVQSLGWANENSQKLRFEALCKNLNLNDSSVLDVGCGYADLKLFLDDFYKNFQYIGIDISATFLKVANNIFLNNQNVILYQADIYEVDFPKVDYVMASGIFGVKIYERKKYFDLISKMFDVCKKAISFNMLLPSPSTENLMTFAIEEVRTYCSNLTSNIEIIENYLPNDFTIQLRK
ncbi:MAG: class I SAM-dependent methyltransferase [Thermoflexibacter sp.]